MTHHPLSCSQTSPQNTLRCYRCISAREKKMQEPYDNRKSSGLLWYSPGYVLQSALIHTAGPTEHKVIFRNKGKKLRCMLLNVNLWDYSVNLLATLRAASFLYKEERCTGMEAFLNRVHHLFILYPSCNCVIKEQEEIE